MDRDWRGIRYHGHGEPEKFRAIRGCHSGGDRSQRRSERSFGSILSGGEFRFDVLKAKAGDFEAIFDFQSIRLLFALVRQKEGSIFELKLELFLPTWGVGVASAAPLW